MGCDARWKFPRASHPTIAQSIAHRILPSRIASYHRTKHRASHPTIAHRILPSHDFSRLHAWSFSAIILLPGPLRRHLRRRAAKDAAMTFRTTRDEALRFERDEADDAPAVARVCEQREQPAADLDDRVAALTDAVTKLAELTQTLQRQLQQQPQQEIAYRRRPNWREERAPRYPEQRERPLSDRRRTAGPNATSWRCHHRGHFAAQCQGRGGLYCSYPVGCRTTASTGIRTRAMATRPTPATSTAVTRRTTVATRGRVTSVGGARSAPARAARTVSTTTSGVPAAMLGSIKSLVAEVPLEFGPTRCRMLRLSSSMATRLMSIARGLAVNLVNSTSDRRYDRCRHCRAAPVERGSRRGHAADDEDETSTLWRSSAILNAAHRVRRHR